jgi:hypothetical protein
MMSTHPTVQHYVEIVHHEYQDLPGHHLSRPQIRRFLGTDARTCDTVLEILEAEKFLKHTLVDDAFVLEGLTRESASSYAGPGDSAPVRTQTDRRRHVG